jgi:hypothetical protein
MALLPVFVLIPSFFGALRRDFRLLG